MPEPQKGTGDPVTPAVNQGHNEPSWLRKLKRSAFAIAFIAIGIFLTELTKTIDLMGKVYDRYFKEPDAFVLAEQSAKSNFSEQLAQRAWRRMFWANNFRLRVANAAPLDDIDASWRAYIDADAEWNANLMIAIVGLERHYGPKRSGHLEWVIQDLFSKLDDDLARLRNSELISALRQGRKPNNKEIEAAKMLAERVRIALEKVNVELYELVRCISPARSASKKQNLCR